MIMETYERGKLDGQILQEMKDMNEKLTSTLAVLEKHDGRLRSLENWKWWVIGASGVVGIGAAKITQAMFNL